jgi:natural product precursor
MKKLNYLNLQSESLSKKDLKQIKGGYVYKQACDADPNTWCGCGCYYANSGGSSTNGNMDANVDGGHESPNAPALEDCAIIPCDK